MAGAVNADVGGIGSTATGGAGGVQLLAQGIPNPIGWLGDWLGEQTSKAFVGALVLGVVAANELGGAIARGSAPAREQFAVAWDQLMFELSRFGGPVGRLAGALQALSWEQRLVFVQSLGARLTQVRSPERLEAAVRAALADARNVRSSGGSGGSVQPSATRAQQPVPGPRQAQVPQSKPKPKASAAQGSVVNPGALSSNVRPSPGASLSAFTREVAVNQLQAMVRTRAVISALDLLGVKSGAVPPALQPRQLGTLAGLERHLEQLEQFKGMLGNDWMRLPGRAGLDTEITQVQAQIARVNQTLATQRSSRLTPTASLDASVGRAVQAAQASSQALQREQRLPQSASPEQRQAAHAEVVRQGEALRAALARPEVVALLSQGLAAAAGGGAPLPPNQGRLYELLMNGLVGALGQTLTDAIRPLTGGPL